MAKKTFRVITILEHLASYLSFSGGLMLSFSLRFAMFEASRMMEDAMWVPFAKIDVCIDGRNVPIDR